MHPTLYKAEEIRRKEIEEERRVETCIRAGICPVCGSPLKKKNQFLGFTYRLICSEDKYHFNEGGYFDSEGGIG